MAWNRPFHFFVSWGSETLMLTWSFAPGWLTATVKSHQAGTSVSVSLSGCSGGAAGNVTVPPALATAFTDSTLVPEGAETGTVAQVVAATGPLSRETALAAVGTSTVTTAAIRTIKRCFMPDILTRDPRASPQGNALGCTLAGARGSLLFVRQQVPPGEHEERPRTGLEE